MNRELTQSDTPTPRTDAEQAYRETPEGKLLISFGYNPWNTESSARIVARQAVAEIEKITKDRDCWVFNTKELQKGYNQLDKELTSARQEIERLRADRMTITKGGCNP